MSSLSSLHLWETLQNSELFHSYGFNDLDYDLVVSKLPNSVIKNITRVRDWELYIVLQNDTRYTVVQLLWDPSDYRIWANKITKIK